MHDSEASPLSRKTERIEQMLQQGERRGGDGSAALRAYVQDLRKHETREQFQQDLQAVNEKLHKDGYLPGLEIAADGQIVKDERAATPEQKQPDSRPESSFSDHHRAQRHGGSGGAGAEHHHHVRGRHHHAGDGAHHHRRHSGGDRRHDGYAGQHVRHQSGSHRQSERSRVGKTREGDRVHHSGTPGGDQGGGAVEKEIYKELTQHYSFTAAQAAGIMANIKAESSFNVGEITAREGAHGLMQWRGERWHALQQFAHDHGKPWTDLHTQLAFMMHELSGSEAHAGRALRQAQTAADAARVFDRLYERSAHIGPRIAWAQEIYRRYA